MNKSLYTVSDIHLEFSVEPVQLLTTFPNADILVLPGDIGNATLNLIDMKNFLYKAKEKYSDVVFIAGNHEFYKCKYDRNKVINNLRQIAKETKTHFLHRESKVVQGIEFVGATLWSLIDNETCNDINDFRQEVFKSQIQYVAEFIDDFRFLQNTLDTPSEYPRVVLTHHLPTSRLINKRFCNYPGNSAFYTNILDDINLKGVNYWFCGHTHEYGKLEYTNTEFIVNPLGYPGELRRTQLSLETHKINMLIIKTSMNHHTCKQPRDRQEVDRYCDYFHCRCGTELDNWDDDMCNNCAYNNDRCPRCSFELAV
jgi:Icc-related predicted phosphoesterase